MQMKLELLDGRLILRDEATGREEEVALDLEGALLPEADHLVIESDDDISSRHHYRS
jgi:hypothetical protein